MPKPLEREMSAGTVSGNGQGGPAPESARRPHICFLAPTTWPTFAGSKTIEVVGGAELQQTIIAKTLASRGYKVSMISIDYGQQDGTVVDGVTIHNMHKPDEGIPVVRFFHPRLTSLWGALKRVDADVYYQRTAAAYTGFLAAFCKANGKRSVYAGASDVDFIPKRQDIAFARDIMLFEYGLRRVDRVFVQNPNQLELLRKNYGREGLLIPNVFPTTADARADRRGCILWVSTVREQKRPELALEIARRMPQYRFVMVGGRDSGRRGEEYSRAMREAAAKLPNVEFKGFLPFAEADREFGRARVFLNTSKYEGFPNTFLQAWSRGVPAVGFTDVGASRDGQPVYDIVSDVDQAVARLERLMSDDLAWQQASQKVLAHHRETHSIEAVVGQYEREFTHLARKP
ncbi:MAG: glycosyltransferase family 4 protein [Pseudomonadota bacterium]|nr:glycosyltransferase family 4 protein [Pseudomonadota bacterium]